MVWCDNSIWSLSSSLRGCHMSSEVDPVNHVPLQTGRLLSSPMTTNRTIDILWPWKNFLFYPIHEVQLNVMQSALTLLISTYNYILFSKGNNTFHLNLRNMFWSSYSMSPSAAKLYSINVNILNFCCIHDIITYNNYIQYCVHFRWSVVYGVLDSFTDYPHGLPIFLFVCLFVCHQL